MSNEILILPSNLEYKSAPYVDQDITIPLEGELQLITEYDRSSVVDLATVYDDERQSSTKFRPTFKVDYIYNNPYTGTTTYLPFVNNLFYVNEIASVTSSTWGGYPQYYEFDFFRPKINDGHFQYLAKSGYNYNWMFYFTYPSENDYDKKMSYYLNNSGFNWKAKEGIPFNLKLTTENGNNILSFECIAEHGLTVGESVQLSVSYGVNNLFEVYSLGNGLYDSEKYVFNVFDIGFTGNTFFNGLTGTFKRVLNSQNLSETTSKYYVRKHKIITNTEDIVVTKIGYEKNPFNEDRKLELSPLTPNKITRISQKNSSNSYNFTLNKNIDISQYLDNQKRPISELFLTIINKGYSGYFNKPDNNNIALKEGWGFNITTSTNFWWDDNNADSNTNITTTNYSIRDSGGNLRNFYYNKNLNTGDTVYGDFCEWNDYEQKERVISKYFHKLKYNPDIFAINNTPTTNSKGFYYIPHNSIKIKVFSDVVETAPIETADQIPKWSYFSKSDNGFRWRDLYEYGYIDELGEGVDYPFLNDAHYPYGDVFFKLVGEGSNINNDLLGINVANKPKIDGCE
jgi:hypothetical protein